MLKHFLQFLFGKAKQGEPILNKQPTFKTTIPDNYPGDFNKWAQQTYR